MAGSQKRVFKFYSTLIFCFFATAAPLRTLNLVEVTIFGVAFSGDSFHKRIPSGLPKIHIFIMKTNLNLRQLVTVSGIPEVFVASDHHGGRKVRFVPGADVLLF